MNFTKNPSTLILILLMGCLIFLMGCAPKPTPYQPKLDDYGYDETRLQENRYRISFKANRYTNETDILDYLYLRSAELTRNSGYSHFVVVQDFGKSPVAGESRSQFSFGMGFSSGTRRSSLGAGFRIPFNQSENQSSINYHLGVVIIRMLSSEEANKEKDAIEINFLLDSIQKKLNVQLQ